MQFSDEQHKSFDKEIKIEQNIDFFRLAILKLTKKNRF